MSLPLSSISRTRAGQAAAKYVIRAASSSAESTSYVVVTHRRTAVTSASSSSASSTAASSTPGGSSSTVNKRGTSSGGNGSREGAASGSAGGRLLRNSGGASTGANAGHQHFASGTFFDASTPGSSSSSARQFHNTAYQSHQQSLPSSASLSPSSSPPSEGSPFHHPKHSLPPTSEGSLVLSSHQQHPSSNISHPSAFPSTSATPGSHHSSNSLNSQADRATLFTSDTAASFPSHALPSFFGAALSIARRSNLVFRNGAYGIPKVGHGRAIKDKGKEREERETLEVEHPLSVGIGEDAYFLRTDSLGVADGVGGWSGHAGANPARWSRKFMHHCSAELARYENVDDELFLQYYEIDPVDVLQRAFEKTLSECKDEGVIGSSTALVAVLRNDELRLANMGDCCCAIIRGSDYIFRSEEQQHSFNFPFQAGTTSKDTPIKDAQRMFVKVQKDDIVILSSDGLCDNLFEEDVLEEVLRFVATSVPIPSLAPPSSSRPPGSRYTLNRFSPQALSESLCKRAKSVYEDQRAVTSPFQQKAMEEGIHFAGGKRDDITTLIGVVGELEASADRR